MKRCWTIRKIGEVCDLATGGTPSKTRADFFGGDIPWLVSGDINQREIVGCEGRITNAGLQSCNAKLLPKNSVMIALNGQGKTRATVAMLRMEGATCNQSLVCISPKNRSELLPEFLYANLHGRYEELRRLTSDDDKDRRGLNMGIIREIAIPVPPLEEQHRIVALLDEAFAGIAAARANAKKNLRNANELFNGLRTAAFNVAGWSERPFEDCIEDVIYTSKVQRKQFLDEGEYPVISQEEAFINGYWNNARDVFKVDRPLVLFGDHTKALKYVDFDFVLGADGVKILKPKPFLHPRFFYHQLRTAKLESLGYARHYKLLKELTVRYPPLDEQQRIAAELDNADEQAEQLESTYTRKLAALDELKQSLLHQAFSGQL